MSIKSFVSTCWKQLTYYSFLVVNELFDGIFFSFLFGINKPKQYTQKVLIHSVYIIVNDLLFSSHFFPSFQLDVRFENTRYPCANNQLHIETFSMLICYLILFVLVLIFVDWKRMRTRVILSVNQLCDFLLMLLFFFASFHIARIAYTTL